MIIRRKTYEKRIDSAIEVGRIHGEVEGIDVGYKRGVSSGIEIAIITLIENNCIIFNDKTGYGSSKKIPVDIDNPESIREVVELIGGGLS